MAIRSDESPRTSLLARLCDEDAGDDQGVRPSPEAPGSLGSGLARDLEALLNTCCHVLDRVDKERLPMTWASMLCYGIADPSGLSLHDPRDQSRLGAGFVEAIQRYESRLGRVRVQLSPGGPGAGPFTLRIEASLQTEPGHPRVAFLATLEQAAKRWQIRHGDRAPPAHRAGLEGAIPSGRQTLKAGFGRFEGGGGRERSERREQTVPPASLHRCPTFLRSGG